MCLRGLTSNRGFHFGGFMQDFKLGRTNLKVDLEEGIALTSRGLGFYKTPNGYRQSRYTDLNGERKTIYEHRAIWLAAGKMIPNNYYLDHINNIRDDNRLNNLQLLTRSDNLSKRNDFNNWTSVFSITKNPTHQQKSFYQQLQKFNSLSDEFKKEWLDMFEVN